MFLFASIILLLRHQRCGNLVNQKRISVASLTGYENENC